jgi:hypothetical protein
MTLPTPNLDDRDAQSLVDEAKQLIPAYCPEWTNHNVSDPGVALIELFAWMSEYMLYRLNQVPDAFYTRMLNLLGEDVLPASAAQTDVTFWLLDDAMVSIPAGTEVATVSETDDPIVFATTESFDAVAPQLLTVQTAGLGGELLSLDEDLRRGPIPVFPSLTPGAALYLGFDRSLTGTVLDLRFGVANQGIGVDPTRPPVRWQIYTAESWVDTDVIADATGGFNRDGIVRVAVPMVEQSAALSAEPRFWLRAMLVEPEGDQPAYRSIPQINAVSSSRVAVSVPAEHSVATERERLGESDGRPDQRFTTLLAPVLELRPDETVEVVTAAGLAQQWERVDDFQESGPSDQHFRWDQTTGEVQFGPRIRDREGNYHQHGAVPESRAAIWMTKYRHGGGDLGNVPAGSLTQLRTSIAGVDRVENLAPASGGTDRESVENAKLRGPMTIRAAGRAVTAEDYERLVRQADSSIARVRALEPESLGAPVRLLLVPEVGEKHGRQPSIDAFALPLGSMAQVGDYLEERRVLGTSVELLTPFYQGVSVAALVHAAPARPPDVVRDRVLAALYAFIHPTSGGPDGTGWGWTDDLNAATLNQRVADIDGVERVDVLLFHWDARNGQRVGEAQEIIRLRKNSLFLSGVHRVVVR